MKDEWKDKIEEGFDLYPDATHVCINPNDEEDWDFFNENENKGLLEEYQNTKPYEVISREEFKRYRK